MTKISLNSVLHELKHDHLTIDPRDGGSPYAYRLYRPAAFKEDGRLVDLQDGALIEVRVFYDGTYTLTPTDAAGRHLAAPRPPERSDTAPMVVGAGGVAQPGALKHPIPDEKPGS